MTSFGYWGNQSLRESQLPGCKIEWNVPGLVSYYFFPLIFHTLFAGAFQPGPQHPTEGAQVPRRMHWQEGGLSWELRIGDFPQGP